MTTAVGTCITCGAAEPIGAVHAYRSAGVVLRCPRCDNVLATIVKNEARVWLGMPGMRRLQISIG